MKNITSVILTILVLLKGIDILYLSKPRTTNVEYLTFIEKFEPSYYNFNIDTKNNILIIEEVEEDKLSLYIEFIHDDVTKAEFQYKSIKLKASEIKKIEYTKSDDFRCTSDGLTVNVYPIDENKDVISYNILQDSAEYCINGEE